MLDRIKRIAVSAKAWFASHRLIGIGIVSIIAVILAAGIWFCLFAPKEQIVLDKEPPVSSTVSEQLNDSQEGSAAPDESTAEAPSETTAVPSEATSESKQPAVSNVPDTASQASTAPSVPTVNHTTWDYIDQDYIDNGKYTIGSAEDPLYGERKVKFYNGFLVLAKRPLGNTGMTFASEQEAEDWCKQYREDNRIKNCSWKIDVLLGTTDIWTLHIRDVVKMADNEYKEGGLYFYKQPIGTSGKLFDSMEEALDWCYQYSAYRHWAAYELVRVSNGVGEGGAEAAAWIVDGYTDKWSCNIPLEKDSWS